MATNHNPDHFGTNFNLQKPNNDKETENPKKRYRTTDATTSASELNLQPPAANRISEANVAVFRALRKLHIKLTRTQHHHDYLQHCLSSDTVPRTLRTLIKPQIPDTTAHFLVKWEEAHLNFGRSLVKLLTEYWEARVTSILQEIDSTKGLFTTVDPAELTHIDQLISTTVTSIQMEYTKQSRPTPK